jgi:predicted enzyme related to lactoylglutathione lyase
MGVAFSSSRWRSFATPKKQDQETIMINTVNWFEIFVSDMDRARLFYETVLAIKLKTETAMGEPHAIFTGERQFGALVKREHRKPSAEGVMIYLNCAGILDQVIERAVKAGGRILLPKTDIGAPGFIAILGDSEGNAVGVHSPRI